MTLLPTESCSRHQYTTNLPALQPLVVIPSSDTSVVCLIAHLHIWLWSLLWTLGLKTHHTMSYDWSHNAGRPQTTWTRLDELDCVGHRTHCCRCMDCCRWSVNLEGLRPTAGYTQQWV